MSTFGSVEKDTVTKTAANISRAELLAVATILVTALSLRIAGIDYGLPHLYHPDEGFEVYRALRLATGSVDLERVGKGGLHILLLGAYGLFFVITETLGVTSGPEDFALRFARNPTELWLIGRATSALLGTGTVFLVWWYVRKTHGQLVGVIASLFLSVSFLHVLHSHYITVDVPMVFFLFWSICLSFVAVRRQEEFRPILFACVTAFAIASKIVGALGLVPYLMLVFPRRWRVSPMSAFWPLCLCGGIYILIEPGAIANGMPYVSSLFARVGDSTSGVAGPIPAPDLLWYAQFYLSATAIGLGSPIVVAAIVALFFSAVRRDWILLLHFSFVTVFFLILVVFSTQSSHYDYYVLPLLPSLSIVAASCLSLVVGRTKIGLRRIVYAAAFICVGIYGPGFRSGTSIAQFLGHDVRTVATQWVEENISAGAKILLEGSSVDPSSLLSVQLRDAKANQTELITDLRKTNRGAGKARLLEMRLRYDDRPRFDLTAIRAGESWESPAVYKENGVSVLVLRQTYFIEGGNYSSRATEHSRTTKFEFYNRLREDGEYRLAARFDPVDYNGVGHPIEIWELVKDPGS